jgi:hypothetical protein
MHTLLTVIELVQGIDIGFTGGHHDIQVGTVAIDDLPVSLQPHTHLALGVGSAGNTVYRIKLPESMMLSIALKVASTAPLPLSSAVFCSPSTSMITFAVGDSPMAELE